MVHKISPTARHTIDHKRLVCSFGMQKHWVELNTHRVEHTHEATTTPTKLVPMCKNNTYTHTSQIECFDQKGLFYSVLFVSQQMYLLNNAHAAIEPAFSRP